MAAQLAGAILLPLMHAGPKDGTLHVEAPGTHTHGHSEAACHVCRAAEGRFAPAAAAAAVASAAVLHAAVAFVPRTPARGRPLLLDIAPRGPPFLAVVAFPLT